jgi:hypothetical protein
MRGIRIFLSAALFTALLAGCDSGDMTSTYSGTSTGDEEFSIAMLHFTDKDQMQRAEWCKKTAEEQAGWKGLFVLSDGRTTVLYWGKYLSPQAAAGNLKAAKNWKTKEGLTPFKLAIVAPLPGSDPGPAAWNLKNSPGNYTVVVAVCLDMPQEHFANRKTFAIDACRALREKGEEAYFFHGPTQSLVGVGSFPDSAVGEAYQPDHTWMPWYRGGIPEKLAKYPKLLVNGKTKTTPVITGKSASQPAYADITSYVLRIPGRPELPPRAATPEELKSISQLKGPDSPEVKEAVRRQKEALKKATNRDQSDEGK